MKKLTKWMTAAAAMTMLVSASAIADSRPRDVTGSWNDANRNAQRSVTMEGRIANVTRDRGEYHVSLDRGGHCFVIPQSVMSRGGRRNDLRVGESVRFVGVMRSAGYVYVSSAQWLDDDDDYRDDRRYRDDRDRGRDRDFVSGIIERIDVRRNAFVLREGRGGRRITVIMPRGQRRRGIDINDLQRGSYVELTGDWERNGVFEARRIDSVRSGRR
ncbi:MAG TPA: hypothetical protein VNA69_04090 [Thermoanaerobaculia bacterium]|nr:hypothetical protein [Thermoanaerobaculia bacterium]